MKKKIFVITVSALILFGTIQVVADRNQNYEDNTHPQPLPGGNGLMLQLRNRICDTLGICYGGAKLTTITGILSYDGTNFYIDEFELHFGPQWYIYTAESAFDYDNDGEKELVYDELQGLVGSEITVEGHLQSSGWMSVFTINGEIYREPGEPIWASQHQWRKRNRNGANNP